MLKHRALRSARFAAHIALILASALLLFTNAAMTEPGQPRATTDDSLPSWPSGLVEIIVNQPHSRPLGLKRLSNPYISGIAFGISWNEIESVQGKPDWSRLDELFAAAEASNKWVQLFIVPGFFSPAWAKAGVKTDTFPIPYGYGTGKFMILPMPWDETYLNRWFAFVKKLSVRYGKSAAFRMVAVAGPTSVSDEFTLPNWPSQFWKWERDGYTPTKYIAAWRQTFKVYAEDFPNQYLSLTQGGCMGINDQGKIDGLNPRCTQTIVDDGMRLLGRRFALELDDVSAGLTQHQPNSDSEDQSVIRYNGLIITGFGMRTSAESSAKGMGAPGNPPLALRKSIDLAMERNKAGQHVSYVEIYEQDVLAAEMQPVLQYAASLFAPVKPESHPPGTYHGDGPRPP